MPGKTKVLIAGVILSAPLIPLVGFSGLALASRFTFDFGGGMAVMGSAIPPESIFQHAHRVAPDLTLLTLALIGLTLMATSFFLVVYAILRLFQINRRSDALVVLSIGGIVAAIPFIKGGFIHIPILMLGSGIVAAAIGAALAIRTQSLTKA